jgi:hypothetical protein
VCAGDASDRQCSLAIAIPPAKAQTGKLTVCKGTVNFGGGCAGGFQVSFTVDTTQGEATIEVN